MENDKKNQNNISFSIFLTSLLTFFLLWIFLAESITDLYVKKTAKSDINNIYNNKKEDLDLKKFWETYSLLKEKYYSLDWIKKSDLVDWAISWMIDAIGDRHSAFMGNKKAKSFNEVLKWGLEWIWAIVDKVPLWIKIEKILKGSPAKKHWLKKWDIIIEANSVKLEKLNIIEAVDKIKWPAWTSVLLKILRSGENSIIEISVIRAKIKIPTVETKNFEDSSNIWYILLNIYWENSAKEFKTALNSFKNKEGIIIDLRNNWGWFLHSAVQILSNFVKSWEGLVDVKWAKLFNNVSYPSMNFWGTYNWKIVVIINWRSASASEITAWALKDYNKAILVWTKTYWKWSVQESFSFNDWSQIKFTVAKWFTPKWVNIDESGINPDILVDFKKKYSNLEKCKKAWVCDKNLTKEDFELYDRQLEESKKVLKYFIEFDYSNIAISKFLEKNPEYKVGLQKLGK
jgi:carboxyl-terminal processing protease